MYWRLHGRISTKASDTNIHMSVLAIIPARGGSKGIPRKNLCQVGGRTLIERAITAAQDSGVVDHVLVSTDDPEIADVARKAGAEAPFLRPVELATDVSPVLPVIRHAITAFESHSGTTVSLIVFTEATVPFRNAHHIREAVERYLTGGCKSVISVCPLERKPQNIFIRHEDGLLERYIKSPDQKFTRRQDMAHLCRLSSGVYVVGRDDFMATNSLAIEPIAFTNMSAIESVNIDEEIDLLLANLVAKRYGL